MSTYEEGEILRDKQRDVRVEVVKDKGDSVEVRELEGEHEGKRGELGKGHIEEHYEAGIEGNVSWMEGDDFIEAQGTKHWVNYGDVHPRVHGGRFLKAKDHGVYTLVITTDLEQQAPGMIQNGERYMFEEYTIYPDDIWEDGKPARGWSDMMESVIHSLQGDDYDPMDIEDVEYLVPDLAFHMGRPREQYASNYWKYLRQNYGISTSTEGVSSNR